MQYQKFLNIFDKVRQHKIFQSKILRTAMWIYGTYNLAQRLLPKVQAIAVHLLWKSNIRKLYGDGWAVVTGGSDGLGKAYATELAQMGFNIIIIGRKQEKLDETKTLLEQFNVQVRAIQFDFDQSNEQAYVELGKQIQSIGEIVVLINNVGTFEMHPFEEEKKTTTLINTNVVAGTLLTQQLIVSMKERRKKSLVIFVGSETGENPHSGYAIQASTKAYVGHLARSLEIEYRGKIDVRLVTPGPIVTNLLQQNQSYLDYKTRLFSCTPQEVAYASLRKVTIQTHIIGTWKHGVLQYLQKKQH